MQISCTICRELFFSHNAVIVTTCGHLYHEECILRWAQRQKTCPQCRSQILYQPFKVYFNVEDEKDDADETAMLQIKVEEVTERFEALQKKFKDLLNSLDPLKEKNEELGKRVNSLETELSTKNNNIYTLKEKLKYLVGENRRLHDIETHLEKAKKELQLLQSVQNILKGTQEEVNKEMETMPINSKSFRQLCTYAKVLKQKSEVNSARYKKLLKSQKPLQESLEKTKKSQSEMQARLTEALQIIDHLRLKKDIENQSPISCQEPEAFESILLDDSSESHSTAISLRNKPEETVIFDSPEPMVDSLSTGKQFKLIDKFKLKRLDHAGARPRPRLLPSKRLLNSQVNTKYVSNSFEFDGMGGSKRVSLATPTPLAEICEIMKKRQMKSKTISKAPESSVKSIGPSPQNTDLNHSFIDLD